MPTTFKKISLSLNAFALSSPFLSLVSCGLSYEQRYKYIFDELDYKRAQSAKLVEATSPVTSGLRVALVYKTDTRKYASGGDTPLLEYQGPSFENSAFAYKNGHNIVELDFRSQFVATGILLANIPVYTSVPSPAEIYQNFLVRKIPTELGLDDTYSLVPTDVSWFNFGPKEKYYYFSEPDAPQLIDTPVFRGGGGGHISTFVYQDQNHKGYIYDEGGNEQVARGDEPNTRNHNIKVRPNLYWAYGENDIYRTYYPWQGPIIGDLGYDLDNSLSYLSKDLIFPSSVTILGPYVDDKGALSTPPTGETGLYRIIPIKNYRQGSNDTIEYHADLTKLDGRKYIEESLT